MPQLTIAPIEIIIERNFRFTGIRCDERRAKAAAACYSRFCYYDSLQEQLASIVLSLVKGHFFADGNKRTALFTYLLLSELNGLAHIEDTQELVETFVELAAGQADVGQCARLLY